MVRDNFYYCLIQSQNDVIVIIKNYIETKEQDLKNINEDFPNQLKNIIDLIDHKDKKISELSSNTLVNQIEDLKKLQLIKDSEINKLNEQNLSKSNEIARLKKELNDKTPVDIKQKELELENKYKSEFDKLKKKTNDLELKIYNSNDKNSKLEKEINSKNEKIKEL